MSLQTCFFQNKQLTRSSQDKDHITWAIDNFSTGLQTFVRASVKKGLAVCTTDKKHKIWWFKMASFMDQTQKWQSFNRGLATLLEGAGYLFKISSVKNQTNIGLD